MADILNQCLYCLLFQIYKTIGFSLFIGFLLILLKVNLENTGIKQAIKNLTCRFIKEKRIRYSFAFYSYLALLAFYLFSNTSLGRSPLADILGNWGVVNNNGEFTAQNFENVILFIPFFPLFRCSYPELLYHKNSENILFWKVLSNQIFISIAVEILQLIFQAGKVQLSDIFYSLIGQLFGFFIYIIICGRDA